MPYKKSKVVGTPDVYKQKSITDYFRNIVPGVNRQLFIDESFRSENPIQKGKLMDYNSGDDICDLPKRKDILPFPLTSDEEETSDPNDNKNEKVKLLKKRNGSQPTLVKDLQSQPINRDIRTLTLIQLNKPLSSNSNQDVIPMASSTPSKKNMANISILENIRLTTKKNHQSEFGDKESHAEETLGTPGKKSKLDITLLENPPLKIQLNVGITVAGVSVQDIPVSQESLHNTQNKIEDDSTLFKTKTVPHLNSSPPNSKKTLNIIKIGSPKVSPSKKRISGIQIKKPDIKLKPDKEEEKLNVTQLELLKKLFQETLGHKDKRDLLTEADVEVVEEFLKMDVNYQYFLIKLFLYLPKWYNMVKFCSNIKLDQKLSLKEITSMYEHQKNNRFVDTDLTQLKMDELLDLLMLGDLRQIVRDFKLAMKNHGTTKTKLIDYLKCNCKTQSTLTMKKSSEDVLKDAACKHLGHCIKLKKDIRSSFDKVYVLGTCNNYSYCTDVKNFLKDMSYERVVYPNFTIENYIPFKNREQFLRFYEAVGMHKELNHALENKSNVTVKNICDETFKMLQSVDDDGKWNRHLPDYLHNFSAEYQYISLLKSGIRKLTTKYFEDVKIWLEFLIKHYPKNHAVGFWYKQLAHINLQYYKNYGTAAQIVIEAFEFNKKENIFNLLQLYELNKIANKLRSTKSYKICLLYCDQLAAHSEFSIDTNNFVEKFIKGCTYRSGTPGKRIYSYRDSNNEVIYGSVENIALRYYSDNEEFEGIHCEGKLIVILFTLLFWDIIYEYYVPKTFISNLQSAPLDMYSDSFYKHRKGEIDSRLEEIASAWSEKKLENILTNNWNNHSHEKSITDFEGLGKGLSEVLIMLQCIDRKVLSKIFARLVTNYNKFRSGLPDLFLWNAGSSKSKFVEVKGENDCLQPNQILWIQHLMEVGAEVEVCHVSGVGAKKIMIIDD